MDRRVRKTREALYSAFISLVVERGYDATSVQDIIDAADVGRTTFYAHFRSKEELLRVGFERLRDELSALSKGAGTDDAWGFRGAFTAACQNPYGTLSGAPPRQRRSDCGAGVPVGRRGDAVWPIRSAHWSDGDAA
ncbi:MAG: TetR/AcrR family transcriptional regulator [Devosia sp.]|nr:TetR/AcrR family transcriptional regulator [Devosia sp.]